MTRSYHTFPRITTDPAVMKGKPSIRGMRVTVGMILGELGGGATIDEMLAGYPCLVRDDILEALRFGATLASFREVEFAGVYLHDVERDPVHQPEGGNKLIIS